MDRIYTKRHKTADGNNAIFISNRLSDLVLKKSLKGTWICTYFKIQDNTLIDSAPDYYIDLVCPATKTLVLVKVDIKEKNKRINIKRTMGKWMEV